MPKKFYFGFKIRIGLKKSALKFAEELKFFHASTRVKFQIEFWQLINEIVQLSFGYVHLHILYERK